MKTFARYLKSWKNGSGFYMGPMNWIFFFVVRFSKFEYEGLSWEGTRAKYKIKELVVERYPNKPSDNANEKFRRIGKTELITKERIPAKLKKMRTDYKKAVDSGRKSRGGKIVFAFYDLCEPLWGRFLAVESVDTGIDSSSASVQDESADSDEVSKQDDEEADFEAAVSQEGSQLAEA